MYLRDFMKNPETFSWQSSEAAPAPWLQLAARRGLPRSSAPPAPAPAPRAWEPARPGKRAARALVCGGVENIPR